jgi:DNA-binding HxlR family transcriptional regulator
MVERHRAAEPAPGAASAPPGRAAPAPACSQAAREQGQSVQPETFAEACRARFVLDRLADKWALYVVASLARGEQRFSGLKRSVDGVSQRMLTVTLRELERDGIVTRTVYSAMPPNIAYRLTPLGASLWDATSPLLEWAALHLGEVESARREHDERLENAAPRRSGGAPGT